MRDVSLLAPHLGSTALSCPMIGLAQLQREVKPQGSSPLGSATCSIHDFVKMELRTVLAVALRPHQLACDLSQVASKAYHLLEKKIHARASPWVKPASPLGQG